MFSKFTREYKWYIHHSGLDFIFYLCIHIYFILIYLCCHYDDDCGVWQTQQSLTSKMHFGHCIGDIRTFNPIILSLPPIAPIASINYANFFLCCVLCLYKINFIDLIFFSGWISINPAESQALIVSKMNFKKWLMTLLF